MTTSIFSESWISIVFDGRNQQYGAYELRRILERNVIIAILISVSFVTSGLYVISLASGAKEAIKGMVGVDKGEYNLTKTVPLLPKEKPQVQTRTEPQPPANPTTAFTMSVEITDDPDVTETMPSVDEFQTSLPGATTQAGDTSVSIGTIRVAKEIPKDTTTHGFVEIMPEFQGGDKALFEYIHNNIKYPRIAIENGIEGTAYIQFVVDRDGSLTNIALVKGQYKCLNDEALRVVKGMPKWKPGMQNGEPVKVRYVLPISFRLAN